jgi:hypothetical protein
MLLELSLRSIGIFAASQVKTYLSQIMNLSRSKKVVPMAPQNYPGASGQMAIKTKLQPNGPVVGLGAVCVAVGEFFASPGRRCEVVLSR